VPKYLELAKEAGNGKFDLLLADLFSPRSYFYREGYYLLSEEFNDISTYVVVLRAISFGYTKLGEIADYTGLDSRRASAYLEILQSLGFIVRRLPVTEKESSRKGLYYLSDNFLCFWSRFIWPNRSRIEIDLGKSTMKESKNDINAFLGIGFEKLVKRIVLMSGKYERIGSQWGIIPKAPKDQNQYEIDIFAINEKTGECLFGECKWQENVDAANIANALVEKTMYVDWKKDSRKASLAIFAKSFAKRITQTRTMPVRCFDLKDLERLIIGGKDSAFPYSEPNKFFRSLL
jgi:AAA+ ATPase superfamily predicted ATPase